MNIIWSVRIDNETTHTDGKQQLSQAMEQEMATQIPGSHVSPVYIKQKQ